MPHRALPGDFLSYGEITLLGQAKSAALSSEVMGSCQIVVFHQVRQADFIVATVFAGIGGAPDVLGPFLGDLAAPALHLDERFTIFDLAGQVVSPICLKKIFDVLGRVAKTSTALLAVVATAN